MKRRAGYQIQVLAASVVLRVRNPRPQPLSRAGGAERAPSVAATGEDSARRPRGAKLTSWCPGHLSARYPFLWGRRGGAASPGGAGRAPRDQGAAARGGPAAGGRPRLQPTSPGQVAKNAVRRRGVGRGGARALPPRRLADVDLRNAKPSAARSLLMSITNPERQTRRVAALGGRRAGRQTPRLRRGIEPLPGSAAPRTATVGEE